MRQTPELLQEIAPRTLEHYDKRALEYWEDTRDHDVRQNISALLHHIESAAPFDLLDLGWVLEQNFLALPLPADHFAGVFADCVFQRSRTPDAV